MPFFQYRNDLTKCRLCGRETDASSFEFECFSLNKKHPFYKFAGSAVHYDCLLDAPEASAFIEFYLAKLDDVFLESYWILTSVGDEFEDSFDSTLCECEPPRYDRQELIDHLLASPACRLDDEHGNGRILWESKGEAIEYDIPDTDLWTGIGIAVQCSPGAFVRQFRHINQRFERVFLHNQDCAIFTPNHFEAVYVNPRLRTLQSQLGV